jgi:hypothetical protein
MVVSMMVLIVGSIFIGSIWQDLFVNNGAAVFNDSVFISPVNASKDEDIVPF